MNAVVRCSNPSCGRIAEESLTSVALGRCPACGAPWEAVEGPALETLCTTPATQESNETPKTIGRYYIKRLLGEGAFGKVYHAHDPQLDRDVAIKLLRPETLSSPQAVERFQREARAAARMLHPHIVPVYDAGQHEKCHFIAQAYIAGSPLSGQIPDRGMAPDRAVRIVLQLLDALGYAHQLGILHRDVKPANVMLANGDHAYLMDFGLAKWVQEDVSRLTQEGTIIGTPAYMAPEQALSQDAAIGPHTDLYAVGVVLYELLTGRVPFEGSAFSVVYHVIHTPPPDPTVFRPDLDKTLSQVVLKALTKDPSQRYATAAEFKRVLTNWQNRSAAPGSEAEEMPVGQWPWALVRSAYRLREGLRPAAVRRYLGLKMGLSVLVVAIAAVGGWMLCSALWPDADEALASSGAEATTPSASASASAPAGDQNGNTPAPRASASLPGARLSSTTATEPVRPQTSPAPTGPLPVSSPTRPLVPLPKPTEPAGTTIAQVEIPQVRQRLLHGQPVRPYLEEQARLREALWREQADAGDADAQWLLGLLLFTDPDTQKSAQAFPWFLKASSKNHSAAMYYVYLCLRDGVGTRENQAEAQRWLRRAAEQGSFQAQADLGLQLWRGTAGKHDCVAALDWWEKAAEQGFVVAASYRAVGLLVGGKGVSPDPVRAVKVLEEVAQTGYASAQYELALCYRDGIGGLTPDPKQAAKLAELAARQNHADAMALFADLLLAQASSNPATAADSETEAFQWYQRAADAGSADGFHGLGCCWQRGLGSVKKDPVKAVACFREAIRRNNIHYRALYEMGRCYELALGVREDLEIAEDYYQRAAAGGHVEAKRRLERLRRR